MWALAQEMPTALETAPVQREGARILVALAQETSTAPDTAPAHRKSAQIRRLTVTYVMARRRSRCCRTQGKPDSRRRRQCNRSRLRLLGNNSPGAVAPCAGKIH